MRAAGLRLGPLIFSVPADERDPLCPSGNCTAGYGVRHAEKTIFLAHWKGNGMGCPINPSDLLPPGVEGTVANPEEELSPVSRVVANIATNYSEQRQWTGS